MGTSTHHVITSCKFKKRYLQYSYASNAFLLNENILPMVSSHLIAKTPFINREEKDPHGCDDNKKYLQYSFKSSAFLLNENILPWMSHHLIAETPFINRSALMWRQSFSTSQALKICFCKHLSLINHHKIYPNCDKGNYRLTSDYFWVVFWLVSFLATILISHHRHQCDSTVDN